MSYQRLIVKMLSEAISVVIVNYPEAIITGVVCDLVNQPYLIKSAGLCFPSFQASVAIGEWFYKQEESAAVAIGIAAMLKSFHNSSIYETE